MLTPSIAVQEFVAVAFILPSLITLMRSCDLETFLARNVKGDELTKIAPANFISNELHLTLLLHDYRNNLRPCEKYRTQRLLKIYQKSVCGGCMFCSCIVEKPADYDDECRFRFKYQHAKKN